jgi:rsbT antagonist protein RsbS
VASIQVDLGDEALGQFRTDLLEMLQRTNASAVILDVSGIEIIDLVEFQALRDTMSMAALMGARTVFAGFRPGVVSALVELDAPVEDITAAFNLDAAFALLDEGRNPSPGVEIAGDEAAVDTEAPTHEP